MARQKSPKKSDLNPPAATSPAPVANTTSAATGTAVAPAPIIEATAKPVPAQPVATQPVSTKSNVEARKPEIAKPGTAKPELIKSDPVKKETRTNLVPINLDDEIRRLAYLIAERRGFAPGHESEDWLAAEREVLSRYHQQSA